MDKYSQIILLGIATGIAARIFMLRNDYRSYPSYPHGYVTHISLGIIAAALGSIAIPALLEKEFTAVTFLVLAAQQFRDIRNMERETLSKLENYNMVPRGFDYIEGIAKTFEARNYLVILVSLVSTGTAVLFNIWIGIFAGIFTIFISGFLMRGDFVKDIAIVKIGKLHFEKSLLMVDNIVIMNIGLEDSKKKILSEGIGLIIHPKNDNARATLNNLGQRQAILHDVSVLVGSKLETGEPDWTPLMRKDIDTGKLALYILPNEKDVECVIQAVYQTPILESAVQKPLESKIGRKAAD
ncbi:MAG: membrane protein [Clostridiaceae bacterium BRH_c20a]|nr:MAG: membrane protein [Clostridiaceae bacterium BRH_c20a]